MISWNEGYMVYFKREQTQFKELTNFAGVCRQYHMFKVLFYAAVGWEALAPGFRRIMQRESSDSLSSALHWYWSSAAGLWQCMHWVSDGKNANTTDSTFSIPISWGVVYFQRFLSENLPQMQKYICMSEFHIVDLEVCMCYILCVTF